MDPLFALQCLTAASTTLTVLNSITLFKDRFKPKYLVRVGAHYGFNPNLGKVTDHPFLFIEIINRTDHKVIVDLLSVVASNTGKLEHYFRRAQNGVSARSWELPVEIEPRSNTRLPIPWPDFMKLEQMDKGKARIKVQLTNGDTILSKKIRRDAGERERKHKEEVERRYAERDRKEKEAEAAKRLPPVAPIVGTDVPPKKDGEKVK